jgi:hypothetical protein
MSLETPIGDTSSEAVENEDLASEHSVTDEEINMTLDELLALSEEDEPLFREGANHKGMKPLAHWLNHMPEDVRKHVANLRNDYSKKTQALAQERREIERLRSELTQTKQGFVDGALSKLTQGIDEDTKFDMWDEEGMKGEIKRQAQLMLRDMMQPAREQIEGEKRRQELDSFKNNNPELSDPQYRKEIVGLLTQRPELKLEDAFYITKAKLEGDRIKREREESIRLKGMKREVFTKSSGGSRTTPQGNPQFSSAVEAYEYWKAQGKK